MSEEEELKIRRDIRLARLALAVGLLVMDHKIDKDRLVKLLALDKKYLEDVMELCPELDDHE